MTPEESELQIWEASKERSNHYLSIAQTRGSSVFHILVKILPRETKISNGVALTKAWILSVGFQHPKFQVKVWNSYLYEIFEEFLKVAR